MKTCIPFLLAVLILAGCSTPDSPTGEKPPQYAEYVKVATYDTTPRTPTTKLDVFNEGKEPTGKYRQIGTLACEGNPVKEAGILNAFGYKARMMGADGIIIQSPTILRSGFGVPSGRVFKATVFLYEK